jgi:hypothetical protein
MAPKSAQASLSMIGGSGPFSLSLVRSGWSRGTRSARAAESALWTACDEATWEMVSIIGEGGEGEGEWIPMEQKESTAMRRTKTQTAARWRRLPSTAAIGRRERERGREGGGKGG